MPHYECQGRDAGGNPVSERHEAESADALRARLESRGWREVTVASASDGRTGQPRALSSEELITLGEEIAGMARAGLPLDKSLRAVSRDLRRGRLKDVVIRLADDLRGGTPLDEALRNQEGAVPPVFAALARAGLRSGRLPEVLVALSDYARTVAELRMLLASALAYPVFVVVLGVGLLLPVLLLWTHEWTELFSMLEIEVPWSTQLVLELGSRPLQYLMLPLLAVVVLGAAFWVYLRRSPSRRGLGSRLLEAVPVFGVLLHAVRMASFSELLALLTEHDVPLPEAMRLAGGATLDARLAGACEQVRCDLNEGVSLTEALKRRQAIPELFAWLVAVGEQRGMLSASLRQVGEIYRRRATVRATLARTVLPPLFVVVIGGGVVCFYTAALMGPLYSFLSAFGRGGVIWY